MLILLTFVTCSVHLEKEIETNKLTVISLDRAKMYFLITNRLI